MTNNFVTVIFDRRKNEKKVGYGMVELCVYLSRTERKYISLGKATSKSWTSLAKTKEVKQTIARYNGIVCAMQTLGMPMTSQTFCQQAHIEEGQPSGSKTRAEDEMGASKAAKQVKAASVTSQKGAKRVKTEPAASHKVAATRAALASPVHPTTKEEGDSYEGEVIDFLDRYINNEDLKPGTKRGRLTFLGMLEEFGAFKTFADLTPSNLIKFNEWLHDGTRTDATIYGNYHKKLNHYIRVMMMLDKVERNPYDRVKFKRGKHEVRHPLAESDLINMRNLDLDGKLDRVRDLFVFSAYTSLAYADVMSFNYKHDVVEEDGQYYIDGKRTKTGSEFYTPILGPAMDVLRKYDYKLPKISNQKANDYLKLIQEKLGLRHKLTFHIARHSFATLAITYGVPIEVVAQMLGHKNVKTTQIYAKILKGTLRKQAKNFASHIQC